MVDRPIPGSLGRFAAGVMPIGCGSITAETQAVRDCPPAWRSLPTRTAKRWLCGADTTLCSRARPS
jgi:hypothetical protein